MIAALSPVESWVLFLACVAVGALVYVAIAGRWSRRGREWDITPWMSVASTNDYYIRVLGGVYDWQARGDFE